MLVLDFRTELRRYRSLGERAIAQLSDDALNALPEPDANSAAMIARHVGGNLVSRFTDFLTTDGEKPWRDRDREFDTREYTRDEVMGYWKKGWSILEQQLDQLTDADLERAVTIRQQAMTVHAALARALAHVSYHVGQLVLLGRMHAGGAWQNLSIPKGQSAAYAHSIGERPKA
jgi:uncharacterized damage-inducible protein DinB